MRQVAAEVLATQQVDEPAFSSLPATRSFAPVSITRTLRRCRSRTTSSSVCRPVMSMNGTQRSRMIRTSRIGVRAGERALEILHRAEEERPFDAIDQHARRKRQAAMAELLAAAAAASAPALRRCSPCAAGNAASRG